MLLSKFLDPKNHFAFKRIFGTEKNQDILIHFINGVLGFEGPEQIKTVRFLKTPPDPEISYSKQSLVDVLCWNERGHQYIIQMQVATISGFEKRAQDYASKAYVQELAHAEGYEDLKAIIFIEITTFILFPNEIDYYSTGCVLEEKIDNPPLKDFSFTFLELPKFNKTMDELKTFREKWCYFFKHANETREEDVVKIAGMDRMIFRAYQELNRFRWTELELNRYEHEEKKRTVCSGYY